MEQLSIVNVTLWVETSRLQYRMIRQGNLLVTVLPNKLQKQATLHQSQQISQHKSISPLLRPTITPNSQTPLFRPTNKQPHPTLPFQHNQPCLNPLHFPPATQTASPTTNSDNVSTAIRGTMLTQAYSPCAYRIRLTVTGLRGMGGVQNAGQGTRYRVQGSVSQGVGITHLWQYLTVLSTFVTISVLSAHQGFILIANINVLCC